MSHDFVTLFTSVSLDKGLVDFIVVMRNRYMVQCKLHRFIFNFLLVRTTSHQIVSRYCCALKPSPCIFTTVDYCKNKFVSWLENFVIRLLFVHSFYAPGHSLSCNSTKVTTSTFLHYWIFTIIREGICNDWDISVSHLWHVPLVTCFAVTIREHMVCFEVLAFAMIFVQDFFLY